MGVKNSKVKKISIMFAVVVAAFIINVSHPRAWNGSFINYYGIEMTTDEYFTLLNLGFSADEIYYMLEETFEENKDLDATLVASSTKYYKTVVPMYGLSYSVEVTPLEYFNHGDAQVLDILSTYYRTEVSTISQNGTKYRYKISTSWLNWPSVASFDVTGIGFIDSVYISSPNVYFNFLYSDNDGEHTSTVWYDRKKTQYGGSVVYKMPSNVTSLSSNLYFDVKKNTNDTLTELEMCGDYAHAMTPVTQTQAANHTISSGGIVHDPSVYSYYDAVPCCYASVSGISW